MPGTAGLCLARTRSLGQREGEEISPKALPESCWGGHPAAWKRRDGADPAAQLCGALQPAPGLCRSPAWCCRRMLTPAPGPRSALPLDADSRCCISKARSRPAAHAVDSGAVIWQGRVLPPPAQVLPSVSIPEGSSRTPKSWSLCPGDLHSSGLFGALVWGSGSGVSWAEEKPGLAVVGFE